MDANYLPSMRPLRPLPVTVASQASNRALQIAQKRRRPHNIARPWRLGEPLAGLGLGQLTVTVTLAEWLSAPDRPVTITLVAPGLVCDL